MVPKMWKRLIVALDLSDSEQALSLVRALQGEVGIFKVGLQLFTACGPKIVTRIRELGGDVFLDLKLHDQRIWLKWGFSDRSKTVSWSGLGWQRRPD